MADALAKDGASRVPRRVLLVEDNEAASRSLARLLRVYGFEVETACDGGSALEALSGSPGPTFLLTDLGLPDLDGREVARHARARFPSIKVIVITGWDVDQESAEWTKWGVDRVFTKPIDMDALLGLLDPQQPVSGA